MSSGLSPTPPSPWEHIELNHFVGAAFAYVGLAGVGLAILFQLPSFIRHLRKQGKYGYILFTSNRFENLVPNSSQDENKIVLSSSHSIRNGWWFIRKSLMTRIPFTNGLSIGKLSILIIYIGLSILFALYKNSDENGLINYKRFGFLAISQLPITFGLSMKNSPLGYLIGEGYEKLNFLHRFTGRLIFIFGLIHWALLMRLQIKATGRIKIKESPYVWGFSAIVAMLCMGLTGWKVIRERFYQIFMLTHVLGYLVVIVTLWYHVNETHPYISTAIAFLVLDHVLKALKTKYTDATISAIPGGLTRFEVHCIPDGWRAGQHVFIRVLNGRNMFEKHPFTIANAPRHSSFSTSGQDLVLVAKAAGDFTKRIHSLAINSSEGLTEKIKDLDELSPPKNNVRLLVEGPYGVCFEDFTEFETVFLCAGGSGFSYCMGVLEEIVGKAVGEGSIATKRIEVVWVFRDRRYVKGYEEAVDGVIRAASSRPVITINMWLYHTTSNQDISNSENNLSADLPTGRPDFPSLMSGIVEDSKSLAVGVCGPIALVDSVQNAMRGIDTKGLNKIAIHSERFGW
ncbi:hypothetical protein CROQUDRAFT_717318 [Cronartium quercuum f. sp. fusiforme G11]|uniref:ferric-chelate reductase (NADPH) n=1 Tax=Cronartium quercuum f. sp. fusiforme G11 TaxID=708437 RepID=A0A9P6NGK4_9BASI|nr:hypothetical protein CROQUDRAFT_717318 [Cronartium quercuum f. sp. fusiforme G11]